MVNPPVGQAAKPTICFVVTGSADSVHVDMLHLSLLSLRRCEPDANVCVVADSECGYELGLRRTELLNLSSRVLVAASPYDDPVRRNKDLRIRLRHLLDGRLLYVDSDTVFLRPVSRSIPEVQSIAAAYDFNYTPDEERQRRVPSEVAACVEQSLKSLGIRMPQSKYNNGVVLMEASAGASRFVSRWYDTWAAIRECADPRVVHLSDQVSFSIAADAIGEPIALLPNSYNTMVPTSPELTRYASILHFFGSPVQIQGTLLEHLLIKFKETGRLDEAAIERCLREGHPWGPHPEAWRYMRSGNVVRAVVAKARQTLGFP